MFPGVGATLSKETVENEVAKHLPGASLRSVRAVVGAMVRRRLLRVRGAGNVYLLTTEGARELAETRKFRADTCLARQV